MTTLTDRALCPESDHSCAQPVAPGAAVPPSIIVSKDLLEPPSANEALLTYGKADAPTLDYKLPLPTSYPAVFAIELAVPNVAWSESARIRGLAQPHPREIRRKRDVLSLARREPSKLTSGINLGIVTIGGQGNATERDMVRIGDHLISADEVSTYARKDQIPVVYKTLGGTLRHGYRSVPKEPTPRFIVIEQYTILSFATDYGAGRTIDTITLGPSPDPLRIYVRSWRRTEEQYQRASSIFDSWTESSADEFQDAVERETTSSTKTTKSWEVNAKANGGVNLGIVKAGGGASGGYSSTTARETAQRALATATVQHASQASSQRDVSVSTEISRAAQAELERIEERVFRNPSLSRTLNLVVRELNQKFVTYVVLTDITVAFGNDVGMFEEVALPDLDRLVRKYVLAGLPDVPPEGTHFAEAVRNRIIDSIRHVRGYDDKYYEAIEETVDPDDNKYWRFTRRTLPDNAKPVFGTRGIATERVENTLRSDGVVMDSLLGRGAALDNFALGSQQAALDSKHLENEKARLALSLVEANDKNRLREFRLLFPACCPPVAESKTDAASAEVYSAERPRDFSQGSARQQWPSRRPTEDDESSTKQDPLQ